MEIQALTPRRVLRNLAGYLPLTMTAGAFYWLLLTGGVLLLVKKWTNPTANWVIAILSAILTITAGCFYVRFVGMRLSRCRIELREDTLIIRGQTSRGFTEKEFQLREIETVAMGERPQFAGPTTRDLKGGRLLIKNRQGEVTVFHLMDKVFKPDAITALFTELAQRGVSVQVFY